MSIDHTTHNSIHRNRKNRKTLFHACGQLYIKLSASTGSLSDREQARSIPRDTGKVERLCRARGALRSSCDFETPGFSNLHNSKVRLFETQFLSSLRETLWRLVDGFFHRDTISASLEAIALSNVDSPGVSRQTPVEHCHC